MTSLSTLIDPEVAAKMKAVAAQPKVPTCSCANTKDGYRTFTSNNLVLSVHAGCGRPSKGQYAMFTAAFDAAVTNGDLDLEPEHVVPELVALIEEVHLPETTTINGVEVDLRSEAMFETACVDCDTPINVEVAPKGVDLKVLTSHERTAVCEGCGIKRLEGKRGQIIHRPVTHKKSTTTQEEPVIDLSNYSKAELAALVADAKARMEAEAAAEVPAKAKAAKAEKAAQVAVDEQRKTEARAERQQVLAAFTVKDKEVPALDLSEHSNLDEAPSAKERSPYNKALHALGMPLLDKEATTYAVLVGVHIDLLTMTEQEAEPVLVAELEPDAKAKVDAFAKVLGIDEAEAQKRLAAIGVI